MPNIPASENNNSPETTRISTSLLQIVVYGVYLLAVFAEAMLLFRIFFLLFSANPNVSFVQFVYDKSNWFLAPFQGIFPAHTSPLTGGYLDISAVFAVIVYALIVTVIQSLMRYLGTNTK